MKKVLAIVMLLTVLVSFSQQQQDSLHSQIFSFSPIAKKVNKVNGMVLGIGHGFDSKKNVIINGLNLEVNPLTPFILLFMDPEKSVNDKVRLQHNGLQLSVGGFSGGVAHNGLSVSVYNITNSCNGISISGFYNVSKTLNGLHIAGLTNSTDKASGMLISLVNSADVLKGIQVGAYNKSLNMTGVQIGLYNHTSNIKGLQIGLWNSNGKRSLPFINW